MLLSVAPFLSVLLAAALMGVGSSVFHPESSRVARMASGGRHGLAQSVFQVGGNVGSSLGPLLAAFIVVPRGQRSMAFLPRGAAGHRGALECGRWYRDHWDRAGPRRRRSCRAAGLLTRGKITLRSPSCCPDLLQVFLSGEPEQLLHLLSDQQIRCLRAAAQLHLFVFLGAVAAGTFAGGPIGDRFGRKYVIWFSILGVLPFTLLLPYANLFWTGVLTVPIGLILASAFSAIVVYARS